MRFGILGPLEAWDNGQSIAVGGPQQRGLLAVLLLNANRVVSAERLIEYLWGEHPPPTARGLLQGCVAELRRALRTENGGTVGQPLLTRPPGYLLAVPAGDLDVDRFEELAAAASRAATDGSAEALERAAALLGEALSLWRGPALDGVGLEVCQAEAARLEERRLAVLEERIDVELRVGRHASLVAELQGHVENHPLRERLWAQLMLALSGADRQADALAAFHRVRATLVDQLGIEPGATLRHVQQAILSGDDALEVYREDRGLPVVEPGPDPTAAAPTVGLAVPAQLPAATAAFTGRDQHLKRLDELLADIRDGPAIGVVCGTAGVGKTALAVHWAHRVRERFADGQLYVNLRGYARVQPMRPIEALAGFLLAMGVPAEQVPIELEQAAGMYRTLLADKRLLVVLDNAHSAEQVRPLLPGGPGCLVLVTSRDQLGGLVARDGAAHLTLDVLGPEESVTLIAGILGRQRTDTEGSATTELARLCAGLPLALRIAAANLALHPQLGLADYVAELATGNRLAVLSIDDDEHSAVRAAFDLSYAALPADARRLFRLLGLVPGTDVTADAAAALTETAPGQARRLLDRLARAHLLDEHTTGRYTTHDLLCLYAAERTHGEETAAERDAATRRLYDWYLYTADAAARLLHPQMLRLTVSTDGLPPTTGFDDPADAVGWLDAERPNLLAAVQHAAKHGFPAFACLLADALRCYYWLRRYLVDWLAVARAGLAAAEAEADPRAMAAARLSLADAHLCHGRYPQAIEHYTHALTFARQTGWLDGQANILGNIGSVYWFSGRLPEAADYYTQGLAIARQTGRLSSHVAGFANLGAVYGELGRLEQAAEQYSQALTLCRETGWRGGEAVVLAGLGEVFHLLGRFDEALDHLTRGLELNREVGDRGNEPDTLRVLAQVHCDAGNHTDALDLAHAALTLTRETGVRRVEADALNTMAAIGHRLGRHDQAIGHWQEALCIARETETRYPEVVALIGLAIGCRHLADLDEPGTYARQALSLARQASFRLLEGQAHIAIADVHLALGDTGQAIEQAEQAVAIQRETGHRLGEARALLLLGHALHRTDQSHSADGHWRRALDLFTDIGAPEAHEVLHLLGRRKKAASGLR